MRFAEASEIRQAIKEHAIQRLKHFNLSDERGDKGEHLRLDYDRIPLQRLSYGVYVCLIHDPKQAASDLDEYYRVSNAPSPSLPPGCVWEMRDVGAEECDLVRLYRGLNSELGLVVQETGNSRVLRISKHESEAVYTLVARTETSVALSAPILDGDPGFAYDEFELHDPEQGARLEQCLADIASGGNPELRLSALADA